MEICVSSVCIEYTRLYSGIMQGSEERMLERMLTNSLLLCICGCLAASNNDATRFEGARNRVGKSRTQLSRRPPLLIIARINSDSPRSMYRHYVELDLPRYPQAAYGRASLAYFVGTMLRYV